MSDVLAIVLAGGKGTRMKSDLPKVLVPVLGRPMIEYVLDALKTAGITRAAVVVGYRSDLVRETVAGHAELTFCEQSQQLGTGHAVMMCHAVLEQHTGPVVVVTGDSPLVQPQSLTALLDAFRTGNYACLLGTVHKENPHGLGRIVRDANRRFVGIVEEKDATPEQKQITEVNLSYYVFDCVQLRQALDRLGNRNAQQEYYLTDCPSILAQLGQSVEALAVLQPFESLSINNPEELAQVEVEMQRLQRAAGGPTPLKK